MAAWRNTRNAMFLLLNAANVCTGREKLTWREFVINVIEKELILIELKFFEVIL